MKIHMIVALEMTMLAEDGGELPDTVHGTPELDWSVASSRAATAAAASLAVLRGVGELFGLAAEGGNGAVIADGRGGKIRMVGDHITISIPGDICAEPGRGEDPPAEHGPRVPADDDDASKTFGELRIDEWIERGEFEVREDQDVADLLYQAGDMLDNHNSSEICGPCLFRGEDGLYYVGNVEFSITRANPAYVAWAVAEKSSEDEDEESASAD